MKTIGIIGGMGPQTTQIYYRTLLRLAQEKFQNNLMPEMIIYSVDYPALLKVQERRDWGLYTEMLLKKLAAVQRAGAAFAIIASTFPPPAFETLASRSPLPLIGIVEETVKWTLARRWMRVGLFAPNTTVQSGAFQNAFFARGVTLVLPDSEDQALLQRRFMTELIFGRIESDTHKELIRIAEGLRKKGAQALILAWAELPMAISASDVGIPVLDTVNIHCEAAFQYATE